MAAVSSDIETPPTINTELKEFNRTPLNSTTPIEATTVTTKSSSGMIDKTLSSTANLAKLLPSGTVLALEALSPSFANKGNCYPSNKYLTSTLILVCTLSCIFFSFTDSLIGQDGKLYYGVATFKGFYVLNYDGEDIEERDKVFKNLKKLRIKKLDYVHAFFSVLVLFTITFSDANIQSCFFPNVGRDAKELLVNLPLGAGFISALVFMIFPTCRKGIGYSDATSDHN
ncbi:hypothetical protein J5N97_017639 [Dioscorea zingiberensis]|uniref:DUF679 domain membrane protein 2 n=1 Tax=Dioscorea zingiberensis TaxID=325984 RepID=A0A9D5CMD8_9LILI|nr:hypothetical protein J5N97_017639 [Dioscorea zingiberensis]